MSSTMIIGSNNLATTSDAVYTVSGCTENLQYPLSNIKHPFTTKEFRSVENTATIQIDLAVTQAIDMFCIKGNSLTGLGFSTCRIRGSATTNFTGVAWINVAQSAEHNFGYYLFTTPVSLRYWQIECVGGTYAAISNIFIGKQLGFDDNTISNSSFEFLNKENNKISKNKYGQKFIDTYNRVKSISGNIDLINKAEFDLLYSVQRDNGTSVPIWMIYDTNNLSSATDSNWLFSGYYYLNKDLSFKGVGGQYWTCAMDLEEVI